MESFDTTARFMDELLDFASDIGEEDDDDVCEITKLPRSRSRPPRLRPSSAAPFSLLPTPCSELVEEELEWISNKDAFPMVESFVDIMPGIPTAVSAGSHRSPVSVLENSSSSCNSSGCGGAATAVSALTGGLGFKAPGKARSKQGRKRRRDMLGQQWQCWAQVRPTRVVKQSSTIGRKCLHCQAEKTPQWRAGPLGPKTLCNACGVRFKSGRLVPEYRPASSPTFSSAVHSNSHRKIVEMRRQKMEMRGGDGLKNVDVG